MTYAVNFEIDLGALETGLSLLATIKTAAGDTVASGVGGWTERPILPGQYSGRYSAFADGTSYLVQWFNGATLKNESFVTPDDAFIPTYSREHYFMNPHVGGSAQT